MSTSRCAMILAAILAVGLFGAPAPAAVFHVALDGNDAWSGTLARPNAARADGPLATLQGARDAVRRLKAKGPLAEPVRVFIADGTYRLAAPGRVARPERSDGRGLARRATPFTAVQGVPCDGVRRVTAPKN